MSHQWWHWCASVGEPTGKKVPLKLPEGKRGNLAALLRFPHSWTEEQCQAASKQLDDLAMQMIEVVRQPRDSIVFNPMQGTPTNLHEG